jgi:uncharacterized protein YqeY
MKLEILQNEMIAAMKNKDKVRKDVLSSLVDAVKKAAIDKKCKDNVTEQLVAEVLLKEQKTMQEMIDTCPADRTETLAEYNAKMAIIKEFAPQLMTDINEISAYITGTLGLEICAANRGAIMKGLKGKADMKIANQLFGGK